MQLTFDLALDGPAHPGPLDNRDSFYGEAWLGCAGLLDLLEKHLGRAGRFPGTLERAARLVASLRHHPARAAAFWAQSFAIDELGTARRLLADRDLLALWGWQGQGVSPRLAALAAATSDVMPGPADRLRAVLASLAGHASPIEMITSHTPRAQLPPLWRALFAALEDIGVTIRPGTLPAVAQAGDLTLAQHRDFVPAGDGGLTMLRRYGPLDAADEVAAALAALAESAEGRLEDVVIIGADAVLDEALGRHGLPRVGAGAGATASSRLLPLVIEAAFRPMDMADLHALLLLDPGPIPRRLAAGLVRAIRESPGRDSPAWHAEFARGLALIDDDDEREAVAARARALLQPACARDAALPVAELRERLAIVRGWAQRRRVFAPSLAELTKQIDAFEQALSLIDVPALRRFELHRLCDDLDPASWRPRAAEAGLTHVHHPGALLAPARMTVWWNFTRNAARRPQRLSLTAAEQAALRAAGVTPPDAALTMAAEADSWARPLRLSREALVLVCPETDEAGDTQHPHPYWDELTAGLADHLHAARLESRTIRLPTSARTQTVPLRPLVAPAVDVTVPGPIALRPRESPSSIERLLGCSLSWALHYPGRLEGGLSYPPPSAGPLLYGILAHHLLAEVLAQPVCDAEEAATRAAQAFDAWYPRSCEILDLPVFQVEKATARRVVVAAARALVALVGRLGATVVGSELEGALEVDGQAIAGRIDLLLGSPDIILDLKWGKSHYRELLKTGTQIQLATYAAMRAQADGATRFPETAYFSLMDQSLLVEKGGVLQDEGNAPGEVRAAEVWQATVASLRRRVAELRAGRLHAPVAEGHAVLPAYANDGLVVAPRCDYCEFAGLCGLGGAR